MFRHTQVLIGDVKDIDLVNKHVRVVHAESAHTYDLTYDQLVLALGAVTNFSSTPRRNGSPG